MAKETSLMSYLSLFFTILVFTLLGLYLLDLSNNEKLQEKDQEMAELMNIGAFFCLLMVLILSTIIIFFILRSIEWKIVQGKIMDFISLFKRKLNNKTILSKIEKNDNIDKSNFTLKQYKPNFLLGLLGIFVSYLVMGMGAIMESYRSMGATGWLTNTYDIATSLGLFGIIIFPAWYWIVTSIFQLLDD